MVDYWIPLKSFQNYFKINGIFLCREEKVYKDEDNLPGKKVVRRSIWPLSQVSDYVKVQLVKKLSLFLRMTKFMTNTSCFTLLQRLYFHMLLFCKNFSLVLSRITLFA